MADRYTLADQAQDDPRRLFESLPLDLAAKVAPYLAQVRSQAQIDDEIPSNMPVLLREAERAATDHPLEGLRIVVILHFLYDLLFFVHALLRAGTDPVTTLFFYKDYPYKEKALVISTLKAWGFSVQPLGPPEMLTKEIGAFCAVDDRKILVIEDGGYVVPLLHDGLSAFAARVIGAVEQTTRGWRRDRQVEMARNGLLAFPVLNVAQCRLKNDFEPDDVARAAWNNVRKLANFEIPGGRHVLVIGYGLIGRALVKAVQASGMIAGVFDLEMYGRALALLHGGMEVFDALPQALRWADIVIGATGNTSMSGAAFDALRHGTILASASSDRIEIGVDELERICREHDGGGRQRRYTLRDGRQIVVLAEGFPVNFYGADSVANQRIDLVMSSIFASAVELGRDASRFELRISSDHVNNINDNHNLFGAFYECHCPKSVNKR